MGNIAVTDYSGLLEGDLGISDISSLRRQAFASRESRRSFQDFVASLEVKSPLGERERLALAACYCAEGRYERGLDLTRDQRASDTAQVIASRCRLGLGRAREAAETLRIIASKLRSPEVHALLAESLRRGGDIDGAAKAIADGLEKCGDNARLLTEAGILADLTGQYEKAMKYYRRAVALDDGCVDALFRVAYCADLRGDNETALEYYQRCLQAKPVPSRALINLGLLYEEIGRQGEAVRCFQQVYRRYPANARARLYLKDALASEDMFFDEEMQKRRERRNKILETPISDFELSVRSRNCLEKMGVTTLGDLTRISEIDLLGFKNFGETSLNEIKQMLSSKNLRLGQALEGDDKGGARMRPVRKKTIDRAKVLARAIDDLGLSVRSQHCMQVLGIGTIGDLASKSERDLMQAKNFGNTSLIEVKKKLAALGLSLEQ